MRSGDPHIAKSTKSWAAEYADWNRPVQSKLPEMEALKEVSTAPARDEGTLAEMHQQRLDRGDFNTGNGGVYPRDVNLKGRLSRE